MIEDWSAVTAEAIGATTLPHPRWVEQVEKAQLLGLAGRRKQHGQGGIGAKS
jgi:hypothetical protein